MNYCTYVSLFYAYFRFHMLELFVC
uniref:Uncharacterized protein n=1 Tax=Arundo donax TaxID=35708 RepID=A0A0A8Z6X4_ARUDO